MRGERKVARYVAAREDRDARRRQLLQYPELRASIKFMADLRVAESEVYEALRALSGGQMARAHRLLAYVPPSGKEETPE